MLFDIGGNQSAQGKPTKDGMEPANQIQVQVLTAALVKGKCDEH